MNLPSFPPFQQPQPQRPQATSLGLFHPPPPPAYAPSARHIPIVALTGPERDSRALGFDSSTGARGSSFSCNARFELRSYSTLQWARAWEFRLRHDGQLVRYAMKQIDHLARQTAQGAYSGWPGVCLQKQRGGSAQGVGARPSVSASFRAWHQAFRLGEAAGGSLGTQGVCSVECVDGTRGQEHARGRWRCTCPGGYGSTTSACWSKRRLESLQVLSQEPSFSVCSAVHCCAWEKAVVPQSMHRCPRVRRSLATVYIGPRSGRF